MRQATSVDQDSIEHLRADELGIQALPRGDKCHLLCDCASARVVHLGDHLQSQLSGCLSGNTCGTRGCSAVQGAG